MKRSIWTIALLFPFARPIVGLARKFFLKYYEIEANHPSNNPHTHFENLFSEHPDPWNYTNQYEQTKYEQTLNAIPDEAKGEVLELACAEGHFTVQMAPQVASLLATDISETAINRCQHRCADFKNVKFECLDFMHENIHGDFDLIVCSEVLYFAGKKSNLKFVVKNITNALKPNGYLIMTHSNVLVDDPFSPGFDWDHAFGAKFIGETFSKCQALDFIQELNTPLYRIQLFRRNQNSIRLGNPKPPEHNFFLGLPEYQHLPLEILNDVAFHFTEKLPILVYPRIIQPSSQVSSSNAINLEVFESHLKYFREQGYDSIPIDIWGYASMENSFTKGKVISINFENASQDFLENAWPLLKKYGFSATVFLYTDEIEGSTTTDPCTGEKLLLMNWQQLRQLQAEGVTFASHSTNRCPLTSLSLSNAWKKVKHSRQTLQRELGVETKLFVYPDGQVNPILQYLVGMAGYDFALGGASGLSTQENSLLCLPRINVKASDTIDILSMKLNS